MTYELARKPQGFVGMESEFTAKTESQWEGSVMTSRRIAKGSTASNVTFFGGIVGLVGFLTVGLLPSLLYGGYAGIILGSAIFGSPIHGNLFAQAIVALGVVAGVLAVGGVFVLGGAIVATGIYSTATAMMARSEGGPELAEEKNPIS